MNAKERKKDEKKQKQLKRLRLFLDERTVELGDDPDENDCVQFMQNIFDLVESLGHKNKDEAKIMQEYWENAEPLLKGRANESDFYENKEKIEKGIKNILEAEKNSGLVGDFKNKLRMKACCYALQ